jgi:hypothetical protein
MTEGLSFVLLRLRMMRNCLVAKIQVIRKGDIMSVKKKMFRIFGNDFFDSIIPDFLLLLAGAKE